MFITNGNTVDRTLQMGRKEERREEGQTLLFHSDMQKTLSAVRHQEDGQE